MAEAAETSKGQITIPIEIRSAMRLLTRDRGVVTVLPNGMTVMRAKIRSIGDLTGVLKGKTKKRMPTAKLGFH